MAEKMECLGVLGIASQDRVIDGFGRLEVARLMKAQTAGERDVGLLTGLRTVRVGRGHGGSNERASKGLDALSLGGSYRFLSRLPTI